MEQRAYGYPKQCPLLTAVAKLFQGIDLCRSESMEEAGSQEDSSHDILTLDALQVCSVPGNPELPVHADTADKQKFTYIHIHTYIHMHALHSKRT
jgi:hypothetical protein